MYRKKDRNKQREIRFVCLEDLVPEKHILRDIENAKRFVVFVDMLCIIATEKIPIIIAEHLSLQMPTTAMGTLYRRLI